MSPDMTDPAIIDERHELSELAQIDLLRKLALYWDGQWFLNSVEEFGLEAAVRLNQRVRSSFGRIEMRSILKAAKKRQADDLTDSIRLLNTYLDVFMGRRLKTAFAQTSPAEATVHVMNCPAFEGAKRAALPRSDQACVACATLWPVWLSTLLPDHRIDFRVLHQLGTGAPHCEFTIHVERDTSQD